MTSRSRRTALPKGSVSVETTPQYGFLRWNSGVFEDIDPKESLEWAYKNVPFLVSCFLVRLLGGGPNSSGDTHYRQCADELGTKNDWEVETLEGNEESSSKTQSDR